MKKRHLLTMFVCAVVLFSSCKKGDTGPAGATGPQGETGPQGPTGIDGNANVTQFSFAGFDFSISNVALLIPTTADTMNRSDWHVYLVRASGNVYPLPGYGLNGATDYRVYWVFASGAIFTITKQSGDGEDYSAIRIIRVYASEVKTESTGVPPAPAVDFNDYYAVCRRYGLKSR